MLLPETAKELIIHLAYMTVILLHSASALRRNCGKYVEIQTQQHWHRRCAPCNSKTSHPCRWDIRCHRLREMSQLAPVFLLARLNPKFRQPKISAISEAPETGADWGSSKLNLIKNDSKHRLTDSYKTCKTSPDSKCNIQERTRGRRNGPIAPKFPADHKRKVAQLEITSSESFVDLPSFEPQPRLPWLPTPL